MHIVLQVLSIEYNFNMDISYNDLKSKEVVNLCDGSKLAHIIDIVFDSDTGRIKGFVVPGERKIFKKVEEFFIPLEKVRRIGDDVILIRYDSLEGLGNFNSKKGLNCSKSSKYYSGKSESAGTSYIRYRKLDNKKYK